MLTPTKVLDHYYLDVRCMLIEIAATLDRYDRAVAAGPDADGDPGAEAGPDPRLEKLYESLSLLAEATPDPNRAERLLNLFSDPVE